MVGLILLGLVGCSNAAEDEAAANEFARLGLELGERFTVHGSDGWVIAVPAGTSYGELVLDTVRSTAERWAADFDRLGLRLREPTDPLLLIAFSDFEEWQAQQRKGQPGFGCYDPDKNASFVFDERFAPGAPGSVARTPDQIEADNIAKVAHEVAHQLTLNTILVDRGSDYPFWLIEGLANAFEHDGDEAFGLFDLRQRTARNLIKARDENELQPLAQLLTASTPSSIETAEEVWKYRVCNAQCWALLYFLVGSKPTELRAFLERQASSPDSSPSSFERGFGDPAVLEQQYLEWISTW